MANTSNKNGNLNTVSGNIPDNIEHINVTNNQDNRAEYTDQIRGAHQKIGTKIPRVGRTTAIWCGLLNIFFPGCGTYWAAFAVLLGCGTAKQPNLKIFFINLIVGFLQQATLIFAIGWIWSIYWAYLIYNKSGAQDDREEVDAQHV